MVLKDSLWQSETSQQLVEVLLGINDEQTLQSFLRDVMTEKEIIEISARLQAAKMLQSGVKYAEIIQKTGLSSRTVARISDWLQNGSGGYAAALQIIDQHHSHVPPARAE